MIVNRNTHISVFDVDGTLVSLGFDPNKPFISIGEPGYEVNVNPIMGNILGLKMAKARGGYIKVWTKAPLIWAERVVEALELTEYVDEISCKPVLYYDDTPCENWMGPRFWFENEEK